MSSYNMCLVYSVTCVQTLEQHKNNIKQETEGATKITNMLMTAVNKKFKLENLYKKFLEMSGYQVYLYLHCGVSP